MYKFFVTLLAYSSTVLAKSGTEVYLQSGDIKAMGGFSAIVILMLLVRLFPYSKITFNLVVATCALIGAWYFVPPGNVWFLVLLGLLVAASGLHMIWKDQYTLWWKLMCVVQLGNVVYLLF